jgi:cathepsin C
VKRITLVQPHIATTPTDAAGTFTMIYDEGFEVKVDNLVFFAFSRFDMVKAKDGKITNSSKCDATHRGWYRDASRTKWGCYVATKVGKQQVSLLQTRHASRPQKHSADYDKPLHRKWHERHVRRLNLLQKTWSAKVYDRFVGKSWRQLNTYAGIQRTLPHEAAAHLHPPKQASLLQMERRERKRHKRCPEMQLQRASLKGEVLPRCC